MATYLQGSGKYIPQIQPYQPDFQFYKSVLDTKNAQYEEGYRKINSVYGTLLNSALTRQDTAEMRDSFFAKANNEVQRMAGVDLSLEENQKAAFQVFKPLTTNRLFAKDVGYTKSLHNEYSKAENYRNCTGDKDCKGWWNDGLIAMQYQAQDFANASEEDAMQMSAPKYVPFVNVISDAVDFAIKSKFEMSVPQGDGHYDYTVTNGTMMQAPLQNYFLAKYGNDPAVMDMYNTSTYLQRKQYGEQHAQEYGSTEAAELHYAQNVIAANDAAMRQRKEQTTALRQSLNAKSSVVEKIIKTQGVDPNLDKDLIDYYQMINSDKEVVDNADNFYKETLDITAPSSIANISQKALLARADAILARSLLDNDLAIASQSYASLTGKIKKEGADPIFMENLQFSHAMAKENQQHNNALIQLYWKTALEAAYGTGSKDGKPKTTPDSPVIPTPADGTLLQLDQLTDYMTPEEKTLYDKGKDQAKAEAKQKQAEAKANPANVSLQDPNKDVKEVKVGDEVELSDEDIAKLRSQGVQILTEHEQNAIDMGWQNADGTIDMEGYKNAGPNGWGRKQ
jgi:hypothetical protein